MGKTIALQPEIKPSYKYNIDQQIGLLRHDRNLIQKVIAHLKGEGISRNQFYSDRSIPIGSKKSISADRLLKYSQVFECPIDELVNSSIKAKSIREALSPKRRVKHSLKS